MKLIDKDALVAEIDKLQSEIAEEKKLHEDNSMWYNGINHGFNLTKDILNTLEVKEMDEQKERMSECPYRQVGCTIYEDKILECNGACSWVVDYPRLKELKAQKGEDV